MVTIISEVTRGLAERYDMEFERLGYDRNHIHLLCSAHPKIAPGADCASVQEYHRPGIISAETGLKERAVWGGVVFGRWLFCRDCG